MPTKKITLNDSPQRLIKGLEAQPELLERFLGILTLANEPDEFGLIRSADEIEELLIEETRRLGKETLECWAHRVEAQVSKEQKKDHPNSYAREKKR